MVGLRAAGSDPASGTSPTVLEAIIGAPLSALGMSLLVVLMFRLYVFLRLRQTALGAAGWCKRDEPAIRGATWFAGLYGDGDWCSDIILLDRRS